MKKYRAKPVVIEAIRWDGKHDTYTSIQKIHGPERGPQFKMIESGLELYVDTLEGVMKADIGDWIIKGTIGEWYPCKDEVFRKKYEEA